MKNYVLLLVCMLSAIAASAQYCSIQKGQKLYYEVLTTYSGAYPFTFRQLIRV